MSLSPREIAGEGWPGRGWGHWCLFRRGRCGARGGDNIDGLDETCDCVRAISRAWGVGGAGEARGG